MNPAKNRERKCSTCKYYQASPLWRKGWCRNPLLYDRNTNHLVEADSLACNRTFIDYWEPIDGPEANAGSNGAGRTKPRIAPSVPLEQVDRRGSRSATNGATPPQEVQGVQGLPPRQVLTLAPTHKKSPLAAFARDTELDEDETAFSRDPLATAEIAQTAGPAEVPVQSTTRQSARPAARQPGRAQAAAGAPGVWRRPLPIVRAPLWLALVLLAVVAIGLGGYFASRQAPKKTPATPAAVATSTLAMPTATGFGDATSTPVPQPTAVAPATVPAPAVPAGVLGPGAYALTTTGLSVRQSATTKATRLTSLPAGAKVHIVAGSQSQTADGYTWWEIDQWDATNAARTGWCAQNFLKVTTGP